MKKNTYVKTANDGFYYFVDYTSNGVLYQARFECSYDAGIFARILNKDKHVEEIQHTQVKREVSE